ncbi:SdrD B-like domain-containing protein [Longispora albida]|uniref:SdrD B-like domain-containing protein n=1 Tax=Longispora albida TaxID=203523 RepID=UPI0003A0BC8F|nr:SdrD B-like domain-containing protein [Longispora albida]
MRVHCVLLTAALVLIGPAPALARPDAVTGLVFQDLDFDGVRDNADPPLPGLTVTAANREGHRVATAQTGPDGRFTFTARGPLRVLFGPPPRGFHPGPLGPDNGGELQFVSSGTEIRYAVADPGTFCQGGAPVARACAGKPWLIGDAAGSRYAKSEIGPVRHLAWAADRKKLISASPAFPGLVHETDPVTGVSTVLARLTGPVGGLAVTPENEIFVIEGRRLVVLGAGQPARVPIPDPGCAGASPRPGSIAIRRAEVLVTMLCGGLNPASYVYIFDPVTRTFDSTPLSGKLPALSAVTSLLDRPELPSVPMCAAAPVEIGNRVWWDRDGDGVQDAGEPGVPGLTITLRNGNQSAKTQTDAEGRYLFRDRDLPAGLARRATYKLTVEYTPALAGAGLAPRGVSGGQADSVGELPVPGFIEAGNAPFVHVKTGHSGLAIHRYDIGIVPPGPTTAPAPVPTSAVELSPAAAASEPVRHKEPIILTVGAAMLALGYLALTLVQKRRHPQ